jgi:hypothetical protein
LNDLASRADEIRTKIRCAAAVGRLPTEAASIDRSFKTLFKIQFPETKLRLVLCGAADRNKLCTIGSEFTVPQPPTVVLVKGAKGILPAMATHFEKSTGKKSVVVDKELPALQIETVYFADSDSFLGTIKSKYGNRATSLLVLGDISKELAATASQWSGHLIVEDLEVQLSPARSSLEKQAKYFVPHTSMAYHSNEFLAKVTKDGK